MKILIVTYEFDDEINGGIGTCLNGLYPYLKKLIEVYVIKLYWNYNGNFFSCKLYSPDGEKLISNSDYIVYINEFIYSNEITHLHIHHASEKIADILDSVNHNRKINPIIVYSCHSIFKYEERIRKIPKQWIKDEIRILNGCKIIHVLNNASLDWMKSVHFDSVKDKNIYVIPNGISQFDERVNYPERSGNRIICASRWAPGKGIEYFIDAIPIIQKAFPDAEFVLVGRDTNAWGENIKPYVNYLDNKLLKLTGSNIMVHNWMPKDAVYRLIAEAKVCVIPSEIEYFPYSFLEPALLGSPIVCTRLRPIQEIADEDKHYLGYEVGNHSDLAQKVVDAISNPVASKDRASYVKNHVLRKFSWRKIATLYLSLYRTL